MKDLTEFFLSILHECHTADVAESEFKRRIAEDSELKEQYSEWCHEQGFSFKNGFLDFCEEYIDSRNSIWDSLTNYDDEF